MDKSTLYAFGFQGVLTEAALDKAGRQHKNLNGLDQDLAQKAAIDVLNEQNVERAKKMAIVYTAIAAFEMSARKLIESVLADAFQEKWWEKGVPESIRTKAESRLDEESKNKWHVARGGNPIDYTELGDIPKIINANTILFEPYIPAVDWARSIFSVIERSRNVIMHSGELSREDVNRVGINIRDWVKQVGA